MNVSSFKANFSGSDSAYLTRAWAYLRSMPKVLSAARIVAADLEMGRKPTQLAMDDLGLGDKQFVQLHT